MVKTTLLMTTLLAAPVTFSVQAQTPTELAHVTVSAVSAAPSVVEAAIAKLAQEKQASSWKITSMRIDSSTYATAILYK
ncbi:MULTISPECIES: reactive chlorine resistance periplasmic protein RclB [unclassified Citrobacter]|uniref:reactive chlorine resistance periplasmic protein RclB n=1 Tax=unclassified Citrobacter TaxID=2644389 RepID=UPI002303F3D6|nr:MULTISPECIES: reactive chlorine resistance periplasmic protein RclB [unclassified Citrobacter]MDA8514452.1 reactive chlorine resistance periplasmic protein RclB [Citrobacter sp. Igbk 14]MDA8516757.1 reactive chlorine resistance periplasmic protein RclB [Citrobacter sp. Igbk 16]